MLISNATPRIPNGVASSAVAWSPTRPRWQRLPAEAAEQPEPRPAEVSTATPRSNALLRFIAAALIVAAALVSLWQAGLIFAHRSATTGAGVPLAPANAAITTPPRSGYGVALKVGSLAPDFEFSDFEGQRRRLSDFRGRPVFINFWATWCDPCKTEMPDIQTVLGRFQADNLAVIAVNNGEELAPARRFLDQIKVRLTEFAYDPRGSIAGLYEIGGMPTSVFVDPDGLITRIVSGQMSLNVMDSAVRDAIIGAGKVQAAPFR